MSPSSRRPKPDAPAIGGQPGHGEIAPMTTGDLFGGLLPIPPASSAPPRPPRRRAAPRSPKRSSPQEPPASPEETPASELSEWPEPPNSSEPSTFPESIDLPEPDASLELSALTDLPEEPSPRVSPVLPANTAALLRTLKEWTGQRWLRRLDSAFASFMLDLCPDAPPPVVMASALVAHMEGRGHSCLLLDSLLRDPEALLGWGPEGAVEFQMVSTVYAFRLEDWLGALRTSPLVWVDRWPLKTTRVDANQPLVLRGNKLYLRRYWRYERQVAARVVHRAATPITVDEQKARTWLDRLFPPVAEAAGSSPQTTPATSPIPPATQVDWQKVACAVALRSGLSVITGGPGTGKTYTAARLLALLLALDPDPERLRVAVAAPTGKAAARLKQSVGDALQELQSKVGKDLPLESLISATGPARTLHALLGARSDTRKFRYDAGNPLEVDVLIVDEASMIHLEMMAALLEAMPPQGRLILLGDKDQLASVEAGAVLGELCRDAEDGRYRQETAAFVQSVTGQQIPVALLSDGPLLAQQTVMLRSSRRFGGGIGKLALAANAGDAARASALLEADLRGEGDGGEGDRSEGDRSEGGRSEGGRSAGGRSEGKRGELLWLQAKTAEIAVKLAVQGRPGAEGGYGGEGGYLPLLSQRPAFRGDLFDPPAFENWVISVLQAFERFRVLCAVHDGEWGTRQLNLAIERALVARRLINRAGEWYEGRPIMVTRNDVGLGVFNGDIGIVLRPMNAAATHAPARAYFLDGTSIRSVGVSRLAHVETAYALTVHKSQGSEFEHTVLVLPQAPSRVLTRELVYTGITRARSALTLVTGRRQAFAEALGQRTQRSSGLVELLDPSRET